MAKAKTRRTRRATSRAAAALTPAALQTRLTTLAQDLWWSWNPAAQQLFATLAPDLWDATGHNPVAVVQQVPSARLTTLAGDAGYGRLLADVERARAAHERTRPWFTRATRGAERRLCVAYFCAEYALHESLPQYAGGLGVLAGDHLKSAADLGVPFVAIGLFYRSAYYTQELTRAGRTRVLYPDLDTATLPLTDTGQRVAVPIGRRRVWVRAWQVRVGRVTLYLLDTDVPENRPADRAITRHLYGGDEHTRICQEIVLGIGGVRLLEALGVPVTVYHLNEGHAAFAALERLRQMRTDGVPLERAIAAVRMSTVFTTHTPVPAGHDRFAPALMRRYLGPTMAGLTDGARDTWLGLGREDVRDRKAPFTMTVLALSLAAHCNGVSQLHGEVSRRMWHHLYPEVRERDVPIGHVTNGVHTQTWLAPEMDALYTRYLKPRWAGAAPGDDWWRNAGRIPPQELWNVRTALRRRLVHEVRARLVRQLQREGAPPAEVTAAYAALDEHALTIGFARRFATYKRAPLIFLDRRRLAALLNNPRRPVQLIFAGKAHPRDTDGQRFAQLVHEYARRPEFRGRVVVLENYDMAVGRLLTSGCDVWLNNPLRPQEASGTSGMKPPLHGGLNCSILDGWWPEAFDSRNGWAIGGREFRSRRAQDRYDATALYELLEDEIVPLFYQRGRDGLPRRWVQRMVASLRTIGAPFSAHRMVGEYVEQYYLPAHAGAATTRVTRRRSRKA